jgi:hypothetical protein
MGRGGVEKDTDQNVNYYAGRAEKSPQKGHSAHVLSVDVRNVKRQVASDPALALR